MSNAYETFSMGEGDENIGQRSEKFKAEGGRSYRISFCNWPGLDVGEPDFTKNPSFLKAKQLYIEKVGFVLATGPEFQQFNKGEPIKNKLATVIAVWPTDSKGAVDSEAIKRGAGIKVCSWLFSEDKYNAFAPLHKELPFGEWDLKITCSDTKFQKMTFSPCKGNMFATLKTKLPEVYQTVLAGAQAVAANLGNDLGRVLTVAQIQAKLSGVTPDTSSGRAVSGATSVSVDDIDSLVDGLL